MRTLIISFIALASCASTGTRTKTEISTNSAKTITRDNFCQSLSAAFESCVDNADFARGVINGALISEEVGKTYEQLSEQELAKVDKKAKSEVINLKKIFLDPEFLPKCQQSIDESKIDQQRYDFVAPNIHAGCAKLGAGVFLFVHGIVGEFQFSG